MPGEHCSTPIPLSHHPMDAVRTALTQQHRKPTLNVLRTEKQRNSISLLKGKW